MSREISYIKKISKEKTSVDRLLAHISNNTANNWDRQSVEYILCVLRTKSITDKHFKILLADDKITPVNDEVTPL